MFSGKTGASLPVSRAYDGYIDRVIGSCILDVHPLLLGAWPIGGNNNPSRPSQNDQHSSPAVRLAIDQNVSVGVRLIFDLYNNVFHGWGVAGVGAFLGERLVLRGASFCISLV